MLTFDNIVEENKLILHESSSKSIEFNFQKNVKYEMKYHNSIYFDIEIILCVEFLIAATKQFITHFKKSTVYSYTVIIWSWALAANMQTA